MQKASITYFFTKRGNQVPGRFNQEELPSPQSPVPPTASRPKVFGEAKDVLWVGNIMVGGEIVIALFFVAFIVVLSERLKVPNCCREAL